MTGIVLFTILIALVAVERVVELVVSKRNLRWSAQHGGVEFGRSHYPYMVALHVFLLVGSLVEVWVWQKPINPAFTSLVVHYNSGSEVEYARRDCSWTSTRYRRPLPLAKPPELRCRCD